MIVMRAIKPGPFKSDAILARMREASERAAALAEKEFAKTYVTWEHKPKFVKEFFQARGFGGVALSWRVYTEDKIYVWVSKGTGLYGPRHSTYKIPKGPGFLAFPSMFKPKTTPGSLFSGSGFSGGPTVFVSGQIDHPGIEPREFDKTVSLYVFPWWQKWAEDAMKVGARESGHG
jgi:hypothetical protein